MKRFSWTILLILITCLWYNYQYRWKGDSWKHTIEGNWDGYGYYAYLPAIFINHSFDYDKIADAERKWQPGISEHEIYAPFPPYNGVKQDKYYIGEALLLLPFFLLAYFLSLITGNPADGYSFFFQISVSVAALFYLVIGLYYLRKLLILYNVKPLLISLTLLLIMLGTNAFYYATIDSSLSHIYSFCFASIFLYFAKRSINETSVPNLTKLALCLGFIIILRPVNVVIALTIPFLAGSLQNTLSFIKQISTIKHIIALFLGSAIVVCLQFIVWYFETGHFYIWSYQTEGFNFAHPHIWEVLFGYRRGWFLYTPLLFIALSSSIIYFLRNSIYLTSVILLFYFVVILIVSSWHFWWYGGCFGQRPMVDFYPFAALLMALVFSRINSAWLFVPLLFVYSLCVYVNFVQMFQFYSGIIPPDDITKTTYWKIFLHTDAAYYGISDTEVPADTTTYDITNPHSINCTLQKLSPDGTKFLSTDSAITFASANRISLSQHYSGHNSVYFTPKQQFGLDAVIPVLPGDKIYASAWRLSSNTVGCLVFQSDDPSVYYKAGEAPVDRVDGWTRIRCIADIPTTYAFKNIKFYVYYTGQDTNYFSNIQITIYHQKP